MSTFPEALPHGPLREVFPGVHFVTGAMKMNALMSFDRNMTVVVQGDEVVLFNTVRLDEQGLAVLDALGKVTHVVRLGAHHGRDDAFYVDRYGATMWAPVGCSKDLDPKPLNADSQLPIEGAQVFRFEGIDKPEAIVRLPHEGGILVPCDSLQNWIEPHPEYSTFAARVMMRLMGFFKPTAVGTGWAKAVKPTRPCFDRLQQWDYEHVLPGHGAPVQGGARSAYGTTIDSMFPASA